MSQRVKSAEEVASYQNDYRLIQAYREATDLDEEGLSALCPSYLELSEISERYLDQKLLGKGGVKEVYRTFDNRTRRLVAMARLRDDRGPGFYDIFVNEAWLTSSLSHPNIISIHDVGIDASGVPFFTMDLKGNTTLERLISSGDQSRHTLLRIFLKICEAMAYAHSQDIIHLDLKPENIQTDDFGEVLVCDWGLGKVIADEEEDEIVIPPAEVLDNMTLVGEVKGSPGYMAPEQIERGADKDHRTDIFALGCILYSILTGEPPFRGGKHEVLEATVRCEVTDPTEADSAQKIPPSLAAVTLKALAKHPEKRYQSVSALKDDVQRYMEGFSTQAEETSFLREAGLFISRNRTPVLIASLALILVSVLSTLFVQRLDFLKQAVEEESQLADQYANEAEVANERYLETLSQSREQRQELSRSLISTVSNLKNKGIFDTPMKSIREAKVLTNHALNLDSDYEGARYQIFALNFIQLNFESSLKYPLPENHRRYGYMTLAEAFPNFDYDRTHRPSVDQLCELLEAARRLDAKHSAVIERAISYDSALRPNKNSYHLVIEKLLAYLNPDVREIKIESHLEDLEVVLRVKEGIRLIADPGGSEECVLRYLKPRSLVLDCPDEFDLGQLNELTIQKLDLRNCAKFNLETSLSLPALETIIIDPKIHKAENIKDRVWSSVNFEIIEAH
ncbi:MAG: serine/threonine protein kinase [Akkermansiaceae bacterium]